MLCVLIRIASSRRFLRGHNIHFQNKIRALELFQINKLIFAVMEKFLGTQEQVRNSRGEVLLYMYMFA